MIEQLKPCPFCGGEPYFLKPRHEKGTAFDTMMIECKHCGALPYGVSVYDGKKEEDKKAAIAKFWNKRSNGWISVDDRLPEEDVRVLIVGKRGGVQIARSIECGSESNGRLWISDTRKYPKPTHWMELPEPHTLEGDEQND